MSTQAHFEKTTMPGLAFDDSGGPGRLIVVLPGRAT